MKKTPSRPLTIDPVIAEALEALTDGFAICEADGRPSIANSTSRRRFPVFYEALDAGASYREAVMTSMQATRPESTEEELNAMADVMEARYQAGEPYETRAADGGIMRVTYRPMSENRTVAISVDVTELRAREKELKKDKEEAVAASAAKSAFLANMSHEIRTPLNGIMGMAQVLEMGNLTPEQRDQLATILDSGRNLMAILNDVLDLSKIEAGRFAITPTDSDIAHVMRGLHRLWKPKAEQAGLQFKLSLDADLPHMLNFDAGRVRQCVSNLISNAIKFTPKGRVEMAVTAFPRAGGETLVEVRVTDTGLGMDEETAGRLFRPFEQADDSTSRKYGGTGLGLSIVRKLAELMGGEAYVESELGRGSEFTFTFLAGEATPQEYAARATAAQAPETSGAEIGNLRVLLVDDHPVNRQVAGLILRPFDMQITEAGNGQEALDQLAISEFDIVLLDMHMPVMDGPETIRAIRESSAAWSMIPVIALTADAMSGDRERYLSMGMDGYLAKPLVINDLIAEITRVSRIGRATGAVEVAA